MADFWNHLGAFASGFATGDPAEYLQMQRIRATTQGLQANTEAQIQQIALEQQLAPMRLAGIQQQLDLGSLSIARQQHDAARAPGLEALQDQINALNLNIANVQSSDALLAHKKAMFDAKQDYEMNPMKRFFQNATIGAQIEELQVNSEINKKMLEGFRGTRDHAQSQLDSAKAAEADTKAGLETLFSRIEQANPGFSMDTNTRNASTQWMLNRLSRNADPQDAAAFLAAQLDSVAKARNRSATPQAMPAYGPMPGLGDISTGSSDPLQISRYQQNLEQATADSATRSALATRKSDSLARIKQAVTADPKKAAYILQQLPDIKSLDDLDNLDEEMLSRLTILMGIDSQAGVSVPNYK